MLRKPVSKERTGDPHQNTIVLISHKNSGFEPREITVPVYLGFNAVEHEFADVRGGHEWTLPPYLRLIFRAFSTCFSTGVENLVGDPTGPGQRRGRSI